MSNWPIDPAITAAVLTILGGLVGYLLRSAIERLRDYIGAVDHHVGQIEARQLSCCDELPRRYADKAATNKRLDGHGSRLDEHGERITRVEGKVGI